MEQVSIFRKTKGFFDRVVRVSKEKGFSHIIYVAFRVFKKNTISFLGYHYYTKVKSRKSFTFQGKTYPNFYHRYNNPWKNERTVEIPIVRDIIKDIEEDRILEVGNVLSHYFHVEHDVVDKYEKAKGVINEDVVNFKSSKKYDLIVSISTLEHVGWDENPREPEKIFKAIENLKSLLSPEGKIVITLPMGWNQELDRFLK